MCARDDVDSSGAVPTDPDPGEGVLTLKTEDGRLVLYEEDRHTAWISADVGVDLSQVV